MKSPLTSAQQQELKERVRLKTSEQVSSLQKRSREIAAKIESMPALPERPELSAKQEELVAKIRRRKWMGRSILTIVVFALVFLMLRMCNEERAPEDLPGQTACVEVADCGPAKRKKKGRARQKQSPVRVGKSARNALDVPQARQASWLNDFRQQVSARGVDLARCFDGRARPGAFRFRATVFPERGTIAEPEIEAITDSSALSAAEKTCLIAALSAPAYRLKTTGTDGLGQRVTLVFEF